MPVAQPIGSWRKNAFSPDIDKEGSMTNKMRIMAAVDLSEYSPMVIRYSVWLSMQVAADMTLVNVINQRDLDMVQRAMAGYEAFMAAGDLSKGLKGLGDKEDSPLARVSSLAVKEFRLLEKADVNRERKRLLVKDTLRRVLRTRKAIAA